VFCTPLMGKNLTPLMCQPVNHCPQHHLGWPQASLVTK
jgi:hypothetical protein